MIAVSTMLRSLALVLLSVALPAQGVTWLQNPANGHAYALTPPMGWAQAEAFAVAMGAHLVTIRSATEQAWLTQAFGPGRWIGFTDQAQEGVWVWTSGEPVTYTNWCPGEPNNASNEDFGVATACGWNDQQDTTTMPGIMEIHLPVATFTSFGGGCPGPNSAVPLLAGVVGEEPHLG